MSGERRLVPATALISGWVLVAALLVGCSGSEPSTDALAVGAGDEECLTDLTTPTATYEVETADTALLSQFLTADAAIVQVDAEREPRVLGEGAALQEALDGARVWAVDGQGEILLYGPGFDQVIRVQVVGDTFLVDEGGRVSAYDLDTGERLGRTFDQPAGTLSSIASYELLDQGASSVSVAGSGRDRVLLKTQVGAHTSQYWTWSSVDGLREGYTSTDDRNLGDRRSPGVCGDLLYLAERDELKVIDTGDGDAVVDRRPLAVDEGADSGYHVLAVPGGVLVVQVDATRGLTRYTWFDG